MEFIPSYRPRRLRKSNILRDFVADVKLDLNDFIMPIFIKEGENIKKEISTMPGIYQLSPENAVKYVEELNKKGVNKFIYFGVINHEHKDPEGTIAYQDHNPVNIVMREVKNKGLNLINIADVCYCEYTDHGHCGLLSKDEGETIDNDSSLEGLAKQAVSFVNNGADIVAPSCMIDGMIGAIREGLDYEGFGSTPIMSYSSKYSSSLYGPFREAAEGAPKFGDRKAYQMDFRRSNECLTEAELDIMEGADMLMIKPATFYLDIIHKISAVSNIPVGAYHISGEYSMIHFSAQKGFLDLRLTALENLYAIKRAGADFIISYFTKDLPDWL